MKLTLKLAALLGSLILTTGLPVMTQATSLTQIPAKQTQVDRILMKGLEKASKKDFRGAIREFDRAIQAQPKSAIAFYNRGLAYLQLGNHAQAIRDFSQAIDLNPSYTNAYGNRGVARHMQEDFRGAIADYDQVIRLNPKDFQVYQYRAHAKVALGNRKGAVRDYTRAIINKPDYADAYFSRAIICSWLGDTNGAMADFQTAAALYQKAGQKDNYQMALKHHTQIQQQLTQQGTEYALNSNRTIQ